MKWLLASACSTLPQNIKLVPEPDRQLAEVVGPSDELVGERVRWGGQIIEVKNDNQGATMEIIQFPLNHFGRPSRDKNSEGRFFAKTKAFLDPYIYKVDTLVTIAGLLDGQTEITIDQKQLTVPIIRIEDIYRWVEQEELIDPSFMRPYPYDYFGYGVGYPYWKYGYPYRWR